MMLLQIATETFSEAVNGTVAGNTHPETFELVKIIQKFGFRFILNFISVVALIRGVYFFANKRNDLHFTFYTFNIVIFLICFLLNRVDLSLGAAFGLFAVFSMLRYRTEDISIKDMTYLFLVIGVGLISAVTKIKNTPDVYEYLFIAGINSIIILLTAGFESKLFGRRETSKEIIFENIDLIQKGKEAELIAELKRRTGLNIQRVVIGRIDFLKDAAQIKIFYYED